MDKRTTFGRIAMRGALDVRKRLNLTYDAPICVYDVVEKLGIDLWFHGGGSFGGMYAKKANAIFVPSLRPAPRQAFTCAHELGHWYYGHGSKLDAYTEEDHCSKSDDEERLVDLYAGHLLMPSAAVKRAFKTRNLDPNNCSQVDFYKVASQLGVGLSTLLTHMFWTQSNLNQSSFEKIRKFTPKQIRSDLLACLDKDPGHLVIADNSWETVPIDLQVGQIAIIPAGVSIRGRSVIIVKQDSSQTILQAESPGISSAQNINGWASFIRVSRAGFEGRSIYRHLEEVDDE